MSTLLAPHIWWIASLAGSLFLAVYYTANQYFKLPAITLVFWRGLFPFLVFTPAVFFIEWPENPIFYLLPVLSAALSFYNDVRSHQVSAKFGGGLVNRLKPFSLWILFALWLAFDREYRVFLFQDHIRSTAIIAVMIISVLAATQLTKCTISKTAFLYFLPAILTSVGINFLVKTAMDLSPLISGIILFPWIEAGLITIGTFALHAYKKDLHIQDIKAKQMLKAGSVIGLSMLLMIICKNIAFSYANNPAYVAAITYTSSFWVALFYRMTGHKEKSDVRTGLIFVLLSIALVLLNNMK